MLSPVRCTPSQITYARRQHAKSSPYPRHQLLRRMAPPATFSPDWCHRRQYHQVRRHELRNTLSQIDQELWNTTPDCSTIFPPENDTKSEAEAYSEDEYMKTRPMPPELIHVGARFGGNAETLVEESFCERSHEPYKTYTNACAPLTARSGNRSSGHPISQSLWNDYGQSTAGFEDTGPGPSNYSCSTSNNLRSHAFPGLSKNSFPDVEPDPYVEEVKISFTGVSDISMDTLEYPQRREYPDLFYAHNPTRYAAYKRECSRFYPDFREFMRRGLQKHKNHTRQEGIPPDVLQKAMRVPPPRGDFSEEKEEKWYRSARYMLFKTPLDAPILECEDSGTHEIEKGPRARNTKGKAVMATANRRQFIASQSSSASKTTDLDMNSVYNACATNNQQAGNRTYHHNLPLPSHDHERPVSTTHAATHTGVINHARTPSKLDTHVMLRSKISTISPTLAIMNEALLNDTGRLGVQHTIELSHLVNNITNYVNAFETRVRTSCGSNTTNFNDLRLQLPPSTSATSFTPSNYSNSLPSVSHRDSIPQNPSFISPGTLQEENMGSISWSDPYQYLQPLDTNETRSTIGFRQDGSSSETMAYLHPQNFSVHQNRLKHTKRSDEAHSVQMTKFNDF